MTEDEALEALREKILALTYKCPKETYAADCPFAIIKGLSHQSRRSTLGHMSREDLLKLFDLPGACACPEDPRPGLGLGSPAGTVRQSMHRE
jgi:hypothetical protein